VFHGWLDKTKLAWYYSAADVTVLPSFSEGFPRTMLEALACGSPFLGTAVSGIVDCITDGETGMLVPPGDTLALTNRLHRLLTDKELACCLGDAGRSLVEQRYSWSAVIARMKTDVYSRFL
jgi:glycosyltransferase involved in cell wall biosynthesis